MAVKVAIVRMMPVISAAASLLWSRYAEDAAPMGDDLKDYVNS